MPETIILDTQGNKVEKILPYDFSEYKAKVNFPSSFNSLDFSIKTTETEITIISKGQKVSITHEQLGFIIEKFVKL